MLGLTATELQMNLVPSDWFAGEENHNEPGFSYSSLYLSSYR